MAQTITLECEQCSILDVWTLDEFVSMLQAAENTRINLEDSGSLNLSMYVCDDCLGDEE